MAGKTNGSELRENRPVEASTDLALPEFFFIKFFELHPDFGVYE
jgi:hypothetical protein